MVWLFIIAAYPWKNNAITKDRLLAFQGRDGNSVAIRWKNHRITKTWSTKWKLDEFRVVGQEESAIPRKALPLGLKGLYTELNDAFLILQNGWLGTYRLTPAFVDWISTQRPINAHLYYLKKKFCNRLTNLLLLKGRLITVTWQLDEGGSGYLEDC
jgi:hypothetical protein